jgi:hypothetical protein
MWIFFKRLRKSPLYPYSLVLYLEEEWIFKKKLVMSCYEIKNKKYHTVGGVSTYCTEIIETEVKILYRNHWNRDQNTVQKSLKQRSKYCTEIIETEVKILYRNHWNRGKLDTHKHTYTLPLSFLAWYRHKI